MATLTFYKRQYDAILCVCMCMWSPAADSWGQTRSNQTFGALNKVSVCVCVCVCTFAVGGLSVDWLVDRKCHLNSCQKCISIERFSFLPLLSMASAHSPPSPSVCLSVFVSVFMAI